jgi:3-methyladenine DNA glycosylase/8-oxoguanine DNA glycosylase
MTKQSKKLEAIKRLQTLCNIGPKIAEKFMLLALRHLSK